MINADNPVAVMEMREVQAAARTIGLQVETLEIRREAQTRDYFF
jgi:hypothetical protein